MGPYKNYQLSNDYVLEIIWNHKDDAYGRVFHVQSTDPLTYREAGRVLAYWERADAEIMLDHWVVECFLEPEHSSTDLVDQLGKQLKTVTECREPFTVTVYPWSPTTGTHRQYGNLYQEA